MISGEIIKKLVICLSRNKHIDNDKDKNKNLCYLLMVIGLSVGFVFSVSTLSREDTDTRAGIMGWMKRYTAYGIHGVA